MTFTLDAMQTEVTSAFSRADDTLEHILTIAGTEHRSSVTPATTTEDARGDWWRSYLKGSRPVPAGPKGPTVQVVELFCGPGGLVNGLRQAACELGLDIRVAAAVDQDSGALEVYRQNHGARMTDSRSVSALVDHRVKGTGAGATFRYEPEMLLPEWQSLAGQVDVLLAGPPCQGHSNLNNRTRRADPRNELYLTVPAVAIALGIPRVVIENVPDVVHDHSGVVDTTIALLEGAGYHIDSRVLSASELGWPQRRKRYFLVASLDRPPVHLESVVFGLADQERSLRWAIEDLEDEVETSQMTALPDLSDENIRRIDWLFDNDEHDLDLAERPDCHKNGTTYTAVYGRLHYDRAAPTITTGFMTPGRGRYIHPTRRRVITAREAARLQGFADTYDFRPEPDSQPSKAQLAKWIGDAVPMPLGYAAGLSVLAGIT